jgi:hypothetical protein
MIDADELIRAVYDDNDKRTLITIIDSLAQPIEPVKTEAIEACIRAYVGNLAKVAEAEIDVIRGVK